MKTFWKLILTFGVLALFILVLAFVMAALVSGLDMPSIGGGSVAVIPIHGPITMNGCSGGLFGGGYCASVDEIKEELRNADADPTIRAIVLDINSGGGEVVASRELTREVLKTEKPIVAWIGEIGASGAYYIASAADEIVADETSMTGSIGVIMTITHYYDLMESIGVNVTVIKAGKSKDVGSPYRPMTPAENKELTDMTDKVYDSFVRDVAKNRGLNEDYVRSISGGKIYLGVEAKELKLVDTLGGFDDAIDVAAELGDISGEPAIRMPEKKVTWADLLQ